ncbi:YbaN family protein [Ectothiorhodospiraceae bacterium WFHF3C12]|nr:YbaN family protein [Ectothiorhodospiraceae bacterium WFHF3C12]
MPDLIPPKRRIRPGYATLAFVFLGLGGVGVFAPLLPTTPFVLLAAWAAARGHPGLHEWLHRHPRFGPLLRQWSRERAIPRDAKILAVAMIALSWLLLWWLVDNRVAVLAAGAVMASVCIYLLTRPNPNSTDE